MTTFLAFYHISLSFDVEHVLQPQRTFSSPHVRDNGSLFVIFCVLYGLPMIFLVVFFLWRVFSDGDCGSKEDPCINYIRNASRRGQLSDQTFAAGFLRISDNDTMPSPVRLFHWDTYSMYGAGQEHEFPVYLLDVNGFSVNVFVQIETTAPLPSKRRSKKRSSKKASERRLSKQASVSDR